MNTRDRHTLIKKLKSLPPERVAEVEDFVDFLRPPSPRSGTTTTMPPTTRYSFGDIVLVPFPFTDQSATKRRPAVVISSSRYHAGRRDLIIMAVTS